MRYQYKIISLGYKGEGTTIYKLQKEIPYPFVVGDEICFSEDWKYGEIFIVKKIQHYLLEDFIAVFVEDINLKLKSPTADKKK